MVIEVVAVKRNIGIFLYNILYLLRIAEACEDYHFAALFHKVLCRRTAVAAEFLDVFLDKLRICTDKLNTVKSKITQISKEK